jgi:hypothetical protein
VRTIVAAALLTAAPLATGESLYVIEQLVVGVSDAPDDAGQRIATVRSGDRVEVLERLDDEARVRLDNGMEGWLKTAYFSSETPLRQQLADRTRALDTAKAELARAQRDLADVRAAALTAPPSPPPGAVPEPSLPEAAALAASDRPLFPQRKPPDTRLPWPWAVAAALLGLAAGFAIGWRVLDRRIRRKYGGLRIY